MRGDLNRVHRSPGGVGRKSSSRIVVWWWVVFGTLLGPGTTTFLPSGWSDVVPGFLHITEPVAVRHTFFVCCRWWVECVVGLLFENYIVNASIFYKKAISLRK